MNFIVVFNICKIHWLRRVLPVVLDIGTANKKMLSDPKYLGIKQPRLEGRLVGNKSYFMIFNPGDEYYSFIDEFMAAIKLRWPKALIQFEDFQSKHAATLLNRLAIGQTK